MFPGGGRAWGHNCGGVPNLQFSIWHGNLLLSQVLEKNSKIETLGTHSAACPTDCGVAFKPTFVGTLAVRFYGLGQIKRWGIGPARVWPRKVREFRAGGDVL